MLGLILLKNYVMLLCPKKLKSLCSRDWALCSCSDLLCNNQGHSRQSLNLSHDVSHGMTKPKKAVLAKLSVHLLTAQKQSWRVMLEWFLVTFVK